MGGFEMTSAVGLREGAKPEAIAEALNTFLRERVAKVKDAWLRGENAALELEPLHIAGRTREEGGGLLYHRPSNPDRPGADTEWEFKPGRARRYSPRSLPLRLVQACGHSGHKKLRIELQPWVADDALLVERGGLRTLVRFADGSVSYRMGIHPSVPVAGVLYFLDAEMNWPGEYPLLKLEALDVRA